MGDSALSIGGWSIVMAGGALLLAFAEGDRDVLRAAALKGPEAMLSSLRTTLAPPLPIGLRGA
jgi:hypothetical protein